MLQTVEAVIDKQGKVRLLRAVRLPCARRALVTILEEEPALDGLESALLSEEALASDWDRPEEDQAWAYLQPRRRSIWGPRRVAAVGETCLPCATLLPVREASGPANAPSPRAWDAAAGSYSCKPSARTAGSTERKRTSTGSVA